MKRGSRWASAGIMTGATLSCGHACYPLARPHPRRAGHLLDAAPVRRAQDELAGPLVVEVDEARVGIECVSDIARNELEHLLEVERRVDRRDRVGQEPQVPRGRVHASHSAPLETCRRIAVSLDDWILALHVLSAFAFVAGMVLFWVLIVAVRRADTPDATVGMEPIVKVGNAAVGIGAGGTIIFGIWLAISKAGTTSGTAGSSLRSCSGARWRQWASARVPRTCGDDQGEGAARPLARPGRAPSCSHSTGRRTACCFTCSSSHRRSSILIDMIWKPGA